MSSDYIIPRLFGTENIDTEVGLEWFINYIKYFYNEPLRQQQVEREYKMFRWFHASHQQLDAIFNYAECFAEGWDKPNDAR